MESTLFKKQATSFACIREHVSGAIIEFFKLIFKSDGPYFGNHILSINIAI